MFLKGLMGYLPANLLQGLVGFLTLTIFTRILSPEDYGRYALALGVTNLTYTVCFCWIEAAMARFYPVEKKDNIEAPELYGTLYRLHAAVAALFVAICALGFYFWRTTTPGSHALKLAMGAGLASIIFRSLLRMAQEQRRSEGRVPEAASMDMLQTGGGFLLGIAFAILGVKGGAPLLGAGVMAALLLPFVVREDWGRALKGRWSAPRASGYAHYGFPITLSLILSLGLYTLDRFLIAHFMNEADVGAYQAGFSLASRVVDVLFIWFGAAGVPAMINALESDGDRGLKAEARQQILLISMLAFPAVAGLINLAPPLTQLLIGEHLRGQALAITPLVTLGALLAGLNNGYFLLPFSLTKKTHLLILAMSAPAIANIALNLVLIPRMGLQGAALAYVLSFAIGIAASWLLGHKAIVLPLPLADLAKISASSAIMALAVSHIPSMGMILDLLVKPPAGILIYAVLVLGLDVAGARGHFSTLIGRFAPTPRST